jgi:hypothetical protein
MRRVFLLYMPPSNYEAMVHYQDTIVQRVPLERMSPYLSRELTARLRGVFGTKPIAVWGSRPGSRNQATYSQMTVGDDILIVEGERIKLMGKVAAKTQNAALAQELWQPLRGDEGPPWELVYFIANPREVSVPFSEVAVLFGYAAHYQLRGFSAISEDRLEAFYEKYDDLYSILECLQAGKPIREKGAGIAGPETGASPELVELSPEQVEEALQEEQVSDHVRMQWKLARLGLRAGERVWVPAGDQARLRRHFQFEDFDQEFAAGIDLPHSYVENIDVVWKQEFRIGAAYEIENSTSIYSGLLRFADLNILAPNTLYPMFIVAPEARRNRVREQLRRPTFRRLGLDRKVRFLSYERLDQIDEFFEEAESGLTVETVVGRSEILS